MAYDLKQKLVVGVSSRILFNMQKENEIYENKGKEAYIKYQVEHEKDICRPGPGFDFIKAILNMKKQGHGDMVEVILMSHNHAEVSVRIFHSIAYYGLDITRSVFSSGNPLGSYLRAFQLDLFLSEDERDVQSAIDYDIAAGLVSDMGIKYPEKNRIEQIRFAFDGDAVLFSDTSERIYQEKGLQEFEQYEMKHAMIPLEEGPFIRLLRKLTKMQETLQQSEIQLRTALVTARSAPAHERVVRTLRAWNLRTDEVFFLGGVQKRDILKAFGAHIFFDDQMAHIKPASEVVFSVQVLPKRKGKVFN